MKKKVLFVLDDLAGGGAAKVISLISNQLVEKGYDIIIVTDTSLPIFYKIHPKVRILPLYNTASKNLGYIQKIWQASRKVHKYLSDYNGITVGVMSSMALVLWIASIGKKNIKIASDHTSFERKLSLYARFLRSYIYGKFDAVTILTKSDERFLGTKLPKKVVMPNPIDDCFYDDYSNRENVILAIGRLDVWQVKGFDLLLKAWSKIAKSHPDWHVEIAGTGCEESIKQLMQMPRELGIKDSVKFIGSKKDIHSVMRRSAIFALTSRVEGFGLVLAESMSQGCACVSFDTGGRQKEIIKNEKEGIIIENYDIDVLANKLDYLISHKGQRQLLSHYAVQRSKVFRADVIANKWIALFDKLEKERLDKNR